MCHLAVSRIWEKFEKYEYGFIASLYAHLDSLLVTDAKELELC